jgi:uncharacterized protein YecT (DUF1311 family)
VLPRKFATTSLAIILLAAGAVHAQHMNEKDSPCANVVITAELGRCLANAKDSADAKLNSVYRSIRAKLGRSDADRLVAAQRLWIEYRDANCLAERGLYEGGTAIYPAYMACLEAMTRTRAKELQVMYVVTLK